ncbi:TLR2 [Mytilus coruscus]|uniref:TLR2 n=1 Tax=Mytilus coruscus TaxID=42192 RepID=A0A6J8DZQ5_MYTCO|nr:TLR2 [Mytilus coruscus]
MELKRVTCILLMLLVFHYTNVFGHATLCKVSFYKGSVTCDCSSLGLKIVPSDCPSNTSYINLSGNYLTEIKPCAFCRYPDVKKLNLNNCPIFRITKTSFAQLDSLRVLLFRHNSLESFTSNAFVCLSNLRVLKISHDLLASYPEESWSDLSKISHLYTYDGPKGERFGKFLSAMRSLIYYNHGIGGCDLQVLHDNTFDTLRNISLKALVLSCFARYVEVNAFEPVEYLSNLSLANQLYMKMSNVLPALHVFKDKSMDTLDLSETFRYFGEFVLTANLSSYIGDICIKSLLMTGNNFMRIEGAAIENVKNKSCLQEIDLSFNRFNFISVYSLLNTMAFKNLKRANIAYFNLCSPFQILIRKYMYQNITIPLPPSIEFINASNIKMLDVRTPQIVHLLHTENLEVIDLADTTFDDCNFTIYGLDHLKVLNMSGQRCSILNYNLLGSCSRLEILVIKHSELGLGLAGDTRGIFMHSLQSLKYLDLSGNDMHKPFIPEISLLYKYRISLQYCCLITGGLYRHYRKVNNYKEEYIYDAFVAHSQEDYIWVYGPLRTFLETEKNFKLALHDRDFIPGKFIADNIIDIIKVSRKIVFVVSRSFLDSEWCKYELDMARMHMFQQNRDMLIVILLDDIPNGKIPSRLKQIWEKITCLETDDKARNEQRPDGDNIFWKRLYLAIKP